MKPQAGILAAVAAAWLALDLPAQESRPAPLAGMIAGQVLSSGGVPQMGASIILLNHLDRVVARTLSDEFGAFLFPSVSPGVYTLRVTLANFFPAIKRNILVQPGMRSLLTVNLAGALSSIELVYSSTASSSLMTEEWKWALRSAVSTRPVLRLRNLEPHPGGDADGHQASKTRALVLMSGGDEGRVSPYGVEPDLGTAFALATSLFGLNQLNFSGNVAYSPAVGAPAAGFRTSYSRGGRGTEPSPRVNLTMRQMYLPARAGLGLITGQPGTAPPLRTLEAGFSHQKQLAAGLKLEYGVALESVSFLETLNYLSTFGKLSHELEAGETIELAWSSGFPPVEVASATGSPHSDLQRELASLGVFPRVSLLEGRATVQRTTSFELGYRRSIGTRTFALAVYKDAIRNLAVTMVAPAGLLPSGDLMPDLLSNSAVFNAGHHRLWGYAISATQNLSDQLNIGLTVGGGTSLQPTSCELSSAQPTQLRHALRSSHRRWLALTASTALPRARSRISATYKWVPPRSFAPWHVYLTQPLSPESGLNIYIGQPLPSFGGFRGRWEAAADLRNLLAQGYLPLVISDRRPMLLVQTPRSVRGALSVIF